MVFSSPYALYVLTRQGYALARRLTPALPVTLYAASSLRPHFEIPFPGDILWFDRLPALLAETFNSHSCHIFVAATGLVVRCVSPLLRSKTIDPAVLVVDQRGSFVISLLSGHLGGGNAETRRIAAILGAMPVITTATDAEGLPAIDLLAKEKGLTIANIAAVKSVSASLLAGETVWLDDPGDHLGLKAGPWGPLFCSLPAPDAASPAECPPGAGILVTLLQPPDALDLEKWLILHPAALFVGIGCRRGTPYSDILAAVTQVFVDHKLAMAALAALASHDAKADEPGLRQLAETLAVPLRTFSTAALSLYPVTLPSLKARERFGLDGVCEPAAMAAASSGEFPGKLLIPKCIVSGVTVAVACRPPLFPSLPSSMQNIS